MRRYHRRPVSNGDIPRDPPKSRLPRQLAVLALAAGLALAYWPTLAWDPTQEVDAAVADAVEGWFFSTVGSAPALTICIGLWILWNRRRPILAGRPDRLDVAMGAVLGTLATALLFWARTVGAPELGVPSLSLAIAGGAFAVGGRSGARSAALPAVFVLLAHPIPPALANLVLYPMQIGTAWAASAALSLFDIAHLRSADLIETSTRGFKVIETCAGLRSTVTLLMGALLYLELFGRSRRQALVILLLVVPLSLALNVVRVISIVLIPQSSIEGVHLLQGMVMLFVGMLLIGQIDWLEAHASGTRVMRRRSPASARGSTGLPARRLALLSGVVLVAGALSHLVPEVPKPGRIGPRLFTVPPEIDGYRTEGLRTDRSFLGSVRPADMLHRRYERNGASIDVLMMSDDHRDRFESILSEKAGIIGPGWAVLESERSTTPDGRWPAQRTLQGLYARRALALQIRTGFAPWPVEVLRSALVLDLGPLRRSQRALSVLLSTPIPNEPGGREQARKRLDAFTTEFVSTLERLGILVDPPTGQR